MKHNRVHIERGPRTADSLVSIKDALRHLSELVTSSVTVQQIHHCRALKYLFRTLYDIMQHSTSHDSHREETTYRLSVKTDNIG